MCDNYLAQLISTCVPDLVQLTVIVPDSTALELNNLELAGVLDSAMAAPLLSVQWVFSCCPFGSTTLYFIADDATDIRYMYCAGICVSDWSFLREKNAHAPLATVVPCLQVRSSQTLLNPNTSQILRGWMKLIYTIAQKLILHTCRKVRPGGLTLAIAQNRLPKLAYLEALWRECFPFFWNRQWRW